MEIDERDPRIGSLGACPIAAKAEELFRELAELTERMEALGLRTPEPDEYRPLPMCVLASDWMRCTARTRRGGLCRNDIAGEDRAGVPGGGSTMYGLSGGFHTHGSAPDLWRWVGMAKRYNRDLGRYVVVDELEVMQSGLCQIHAEAGS